ncbi:MAG: electron transfer flavoprotein-ubiquinone oxidoreductase [Alphaproteobacteria bacterium]
MSRESMEFDVVVVGAGPAGLAAAIRLRQRAAEAGAELSVCVVEKGSEVGAHLLSGAVLDPRALTELLPDWQDTGAPLKTAATRDRFVLLTRRHAIPLPTPPQMRNHGNYIISLGNLARWLAGRAEEMGVEIYPGFAAAEVLYDDSGAVAGVATGDLGLNKDGSPGPNHQPGVELRARQTLFGEGCRGSLTKELFARFSLGADCEPQTYGIGIKELWEVDPARYRPGEVMHTIGWPLDHGTYGGSFLYHLEDNQVAVGFVIGLDYTNPYLSPFEEMQRFKTHPAIRGLFEGGRRIAYGSRALTEGGYQSIPKLTFPGGALIGCGAGFMNVPRIKGIHNAMKSGMVAAESVFDLLHPAAASAPAAAASTSASTASPVSAASSEARDYRSRLESTWLMRELRAVRNIRPGFHLGLLPGLAYAAIDTYVLRGRAPWTLGHRKDHQTLTPAVRARPIYYPKPDGKLTFDRLSSVFVSNTNHAENQPCHLRLADPALAITVNNAVYAAPETRYCPAGVYEIVESNDPSGGPKLVINAQNCVHCKTCDIKDPTQNITWVPPEGGGGPNYPNM